MTGAGRLIAVVGPDGVGKSTLARALLETWTGPTAYVHFRPPLTGTMSPFPPEHPAVQPAKGPLTGGRALGAARLVRSLWLFWIGYLCTVRPALRRGTLVVADRWSYGYVGQPHALRFYGPTFLGRLAVRLMPQADLVANLVADPEVIVLRKAELTLDEVALELQQWAGLPVRRLRTYCSEEAPGPLARRVLTDLAAETAR